MILTPDRVFVCLRIGPFRGCSPVLGTKHLEFDWFVPQTGLQS